MLLGSALLACLEALLHWEVYAAAMIYIILTFGPTFILLWLNKSAGLIAGFFVQPFFHALGIMTFVTLVAPIAMGFGDDAIWSLPLKFVSDAPREVAKDAFLLIFASIFIAFIPLLGGLPSFNSLVLGVIATGMVFNLAGVEGLSRSELVPSFGVGIGLLLLGGTVSILGSIAATIVSEGVAFIFGRSPEELGSVISFPIIAAMGFVPLLLYLSWLGASLN